MTIPVLSNPLSSSFQYISMAMPWDTTLKSYFEPKSDHDVLRTSVETIIFTMLGERPMLNTFGSSIMTLIFDQATGILQGELTSIVRDVVPKWDPRLEVLSVKTAVLEQEDNKAEVTVVYRNRYDPRSVPETTTLVVGG